MIHFSQKNGLDKREWEIAFIEARETDASQDETCVFSCLNY